MTDLSYQLKVCLALAVFFLVSFCIRIHGRGAGVAIAFDHLAHLSAIQWNHAAVRHPMSLQCSHLLGSTPSGQIDSERKV